MGIAVNGPENRHRDDHAAIELKAALAAWLRRAGHEVIDLGPAAADSVDYPDYGYKLAEHVGGGQADKGVALCGYGRPLWRRPRCTPRRQAFPSAKAGRVD